jgi:dienelactone hydrolase
MDIVSEVTEKGVTERRFDVKVGDDVVPGIAWLPEGAGTATPTILIGHGGTQHKRVPNVLSLGRRVVRHLGWAAVAIDAPDHGERVTDPAAAEKARKRLEQRIAAGERRMDLSADEARAFVERSQRGVGDWQATVDVIEAQPWSDGRFGYWGVSMGTVIGLPFVAAEPRVSCAVLGLAGLGGPMSGSRFEEAARSLTIPVLFVFQWDDELMSRESGLALFDAIGSKDKAMHIHPGGHVATPLHERDAYNAFFQRHLS